MPHVFFSRNQEVGLVITDLKKYYSIRPGVTYLNHGSFGITPQPVREARDRWTAALEQNPMDMFVRQYESLLGNARHRLAELVGARPENLVFADNATNAMNVVASSFPLSAGDEILLNSHEYGAVFKIWTRVAQRVGATVKVVPLGNQFQSPDEILHPILEAVTPKTRLVVASHITSATAIVFPITQLVTELKQRGIPVAIDGPHAVAALPLSLEELGADFYCASCHKWLSAPLGTGFLYVAPHWQDRVVPLNESWGRLLPAIAERWDERFTWQGTRDLAHWLAIPAAIDFLAGVGWDNFRNYVKQRTVLARQAVGELTKQPSMVPDDDDWFTTMAQVTLPTGDWSTLQQRLWENHQIEIPVIDFQDHWYIRVSSYLYNDQNDLDRLIEALKRELTSD